MVGRRKISRGGGIAATYKKICSTATRVNHGDGEPSKVFPVKSHLSASTVSRDGSLVWQVNPTYRHTKSSSAC